jgi:membrane associated rhomboid family serine protease
LTAPEFVAKLIRCEQADGRGPKVRDLRHLKRMLVGVAAFVAVLWLIHLAGILFGLDLGRLGISPRQSSTLGGLLFMPLIHGSWSHLFSNSGPLLVLGTAMLHSFPRASRVALPAIWLGSGLGVWLFARAGFHIGASGLTYGMMFFVFVIGMLRRDRASMALSMIVFLLYGGTIWGLFPHQPGVSFEAHVSGAVVGTLCAFWLRWRDPPPPRRAYAWESKESRRHEPPDTGEVLPPGHPDELTRRARERDR